MIPSLSRGLLLGCLASASLFATASAQVVIAYWHFNVLSGHVWTSPIEADVGTGQISLAGWTGATDTTTGHATNAQFGEVAGNAFTLVGQSGNGSHIDLVFSMAGLQDLTVSFASRGTSTGFNSSTWSYSTNGTDFFPLPDHNNTATNNTSYSLRLVSDSAITVLDDSPLAILRYTLSGTSSGSGNNRLDNLLIQATPIPEPSQVGLLAAALAIAFVVARRRRH